MISRLGLVRSSEWLASLGLDPEQASEKAGGEIKDDWGGDCAQKGPQGFGPPGPCGDLGDRLPLGSKGRDYPGSRVEVGEAVLIEAALIHLA